MQMSSWKFMNFPAALHQVWSCFSFGRGRTIVHCRTIWHCRRIRHFTGLGVCGWVVLGISSWESLVPNIAEPYSPLSFYCPAGSLALTSLHWTSFSIQKYVSKTFVLIYGQSFPSLAWPLTTRPNLHGVRSFSDPLTKSHFWRHHKALPAKISWLKISAVSSTS